MKQPLLVAFIGPVGSGKTHVAKILARQLGALSIRTDDIRVSLRNRDMSFGRAPNIARQRATLALRRGRSVILDFDAARAGRRRELAAKAKRFGAKMVVIQVKAPEKVILSRLRRHHYTSKDLFMDAEEAVRVYRIRRKYHGRKLKAKPDFVINNARPLLPQIERVVKKLKGP